MTDNEIKKLMELIMEVTGKRGVVITPEMTDEEVKQVVEKLEHPERIDN